MPQVSKIVLKNCRRVTIGTLSEHSVFGLFDVLIIWTTVLNDYLMIQFPLKCSLIFEMKCCLLLNPVVSNGLILNMAVNKR